MYTDRQTETNAKHTETHREKRGQKQQRVQEREV